MADVDARSAVRHARGSGGQAPAAGLGRDLSELAREMQAEPSMESLLERIVEAAVVEIPPAEHAGISEIRERNRVQTRGATSELVHRIDDLQYQAGDGPCLTSLREEVTVRSEDLAADTRWPRFARAAAELGVRSMLSVQLFVESDNIGALNLYSGTPAAFLDEHEDVAMLLAAHAAIAIKGSKVENNLKTALASRDVIGQAKGILMERFKIGASEAFDLLVMVSQRTHQKLRDVADELTATGELRVD